MHIYTQRERDKRERERERERESKRRYTHSFIKNNKLMKNENFNFISNNFIIKTN